MPEFIRRRLNIRELPSPYIWLSVMLVIIWSLPISKASERLAVCILHIYIYHSKKMVLNSTKSGSNPSLGKAYPSDTVSIELPSDVGESLPARQNLPFPSCSRRDLPIHAVSVCLQTDVGEASRPHNFTFLSYLSDSVSPDLLTDAGESTPGQTILPFQVPRLARLTRPTQ